MITAQQYYDEIQKIPPISSGDCALDTLLRGGFTSGPVYVLSGPSSLLSVILMRTAVNAFCARVDGGSELQQVAYIDGENSFNPYFISKCAVSRHLNPTYVLDRILIARTFTWNQMVEVLEEKVAQLENVELVLVSGITSMFEETAQDPSKARNVSSSRRTASPMNWQTFQELNRMIAGLKNVIKSADPLIILTGPFNSKSRFRPAGGQIMAHFGGVLIGIEDDERYIDYTLHQHPSMAFHTERIWKTMQMRDNTRARSHLSSNPHNLTLDSFFIK